jgi:MFS family permease
MAHTAPAILTEDSRSSPLPGARPALILLVAINLFNYLDRQVLAAVVPLLKDIDKGPLAIGVLDWLENQLGFRAENALLGSLNTAFMATYMLLAPVFGRLAERLPRWWIVGFAVIAWSLASGASGLAVTLEILFLTRCLVGVGEAAYGPAAPSMISDYYPVRVRGKVLAMFYMAIPVGSALGYMLGGGVAGIMSRWQPEWAVVNGTNLLEPWRPAFYLVVLPGIALGILCFFRSEPARGQADLEKGKPAHRPRIKDYLILLRTPSYVLCTLGMTAMTFAIGGIAFWMPDYIYEHEQGRTALGTIGFVFGAIVVVAGLLATLLGGIAGDWLRKYYSGSYFLVAGAGMLVGFPLFLAVLYTDFSPFPWAWIFVFLACFALFFNTGPTNTVLANVTHPSMRATGFAVNIFVIHAFGDAVSPLIIGAIKDRYSLQTGFLVVSGMMVVAGLLWLWGARYLQRDTELAPRRLG